MAGLQCLQFQAKMKEQKVVLITGCSSGIGLRLTQLLQEFEDYKVYATSRSTTELNDCVGSKVTIRQLDVSSQDDISNVVGAIIDKEGKIDVLVHCAAIGYCSPVEHINMATAELVINTNTIGLINLTNTVLPIMKEKKRGHIVAISAVGGKIGFPFNSVYSASKFATEGFCEALREEVAHQNIVVTLVQPGPVFTDFCSKSMCYVKSIDGAKRIEGSDYTTKQLLDTYMQQNTAQHQTMGQPVDDVTQIIIDCIQQPATTPFRVTTNTVYTNALSRVYKEPIETCPKIQ